MNIALILSVDFYISLIVWCMGDDEIKFFASNVSKNVFGEQVKIQISSLQLRLYEPQMVTRVRHTVGTS